MSTRPKRPCRHAGCSALVTSGYCAEHARVQRAVYRGSGDRAQVEAWYNSRRWRRISAAYLAEHPWCAVCCAPAAHTDHVVPHGGDQRAFWAGELQALCVSCHSRKTQEEQRQ